MRTVMMALVVLVSACTMERVDVTDVQCDQHGVLVCDGEVVCEGEYQSNDPGTYPSYVACDRDGRAYCRQMVNYADAPRPEQTPVCVR